MTRRIAPGCPFVPCVFVAFSTADRVYLEYLYEEHQVGRGAKAQGPVLNPSHFALNSQLEFNSTFKMLLSVSECDESRL